MVLACYLATARYESSVPGELVDLALNKVKECIRISRLTSSLIVKFIRKALNTGVWYKLPLVSRALLLAVKRLPVVKSPVLRNVLLDIMVKIELFTLRGKAVFYGVLVAVRSGFLEDLSSVKRLITLGVSYLNLPELWRILG